jgi:hypothetical protein
VFAAPAIDSSLIGKGYCHLCSGCLHNMSHLQHIPKSESCPRISSRPIFWIVSQCLSPKRLKLSRPVTLASKIFTDFGQEAICGRQQESTTV